LTSKDFVWSEYQKAIFSNVKEGKPGSHLIVQARAGSAKTTSLLQSLRYISPKDKTLIVAFNKKIATELQDRAPEYSNLTISTLHSLGYKIVREAMGKPVKFDPDKAFKIIKDCFAKDKKNEKEKDNYELIYEAKRTITLMKNLIVDTPTKIDELMDEYGVSSGDYDREEFIEKLIWILGECKKRFTSLDFDDMVWYPFVFNLTDPVYDRVLIDETQDLYKVSLNLALSSCKKNGRVFAYLDDRQTLYGFLGADTDCLITLQKKLNANILSLPISYRCGKKIIFKAQEIVPDITYNPANPNEGEVHKIEEDQIVDLIKPGDFLLSRTNAPLVSHCFSLWRNKIPANIKGKELGIGLSAVIKQSNKRTVSSFLDWLDLWQKEEIERLKAKKRDYNLVLDRVECLKVLCEGKTTIEEVKETMQELFDDKGKAVELSSIHSIKGKESDNVFFLTSTMIFGTSIAEKNCEYVAITRARKNLYLVV
jgi:ATP-dependent DNA helicase UvrD/PcrA